MADSAKGEALAPPPKLERDLRTRLLGEYGILIIVVVMAAALSFLQPQYFLSAQNITNIVRQIGMNALLALGMYLVILTAGIDLSVGSVMALYQGTNFADAPLTETSRNEVIGWIMGTKGHKDSLAHDRVH